MSWLFLGSFQVELTRPENAVVIIFQDFHHLSCSGASAFADEHRIFVTFLDNFVLGWSSSGKM